jgi:hypothetical protein
MAIRSSFFNCKNQLRFITTNSVDGQYVSRCDSFPEISYTSPDYDTSVVLVESIINRLETDIGELKNDNKILCS